MSTPSPRRPASPAGSPQVSPPAPPAGAAVAGVAPVGVAAAGPYVAATETLRSTVRWLVAAAAGVGGVLVAGLQLTGLGSLGRADLLRLGLAFGGLVVALTAVGYMILRASQILTDEWVTLADLDKEMFYRRIREGAREHDNAPASIRGRLRQRLERIRDRRDRQRSDIINGLSERLELIKEELFGSIAASVPDLYARLVQANEAARRNPQSCPARAAAPLQQAAGTVVAVANFYLTCQQFKRLRRQLATAAAVAVIGVLTFAYAANPAHPNSTASNQIAG